MNFGSHISETFFIRKLFQSARLYILGIVRKLASKCAWQIIRFWYHSYERMLVELELSIENMDFKVDGSSIYTTIERIKLNLFNILMILNKWIIRWFTFDVTTRSLTTQSPFLSIIIIRLSGHAQTFHDSSFSGMSFSPLYLYNWLNFVFAIAGWDQLDQCCLFKATTATTPTIKMFFYDKSNPTKLITPTNCFPFPLHRLLF